MLTDSQLHLIKLSVGTCSVDDLRLWQSKQMARHSGRNALASFDRWPTHVTRHYPRRHAELLAGGSVFWVIRGHIQARQRLVGIEPVFDENGRRNCCLVLDQQVIPVEQTRHRPFQGWRYIHADQVPPDFNGDEPDSHVPLAMRNALADLGVL